MNEEEFINSIDCKFPYHDKSAWTIIVNQSYKVSSNATFAVLYEICLVPYNTKVNTDDLKEIANYWFQNAKHPLASTIHEIAISMINGDEISVLQAIEVMDIVSKHKNEFSALSIAYFSCNDIEGKADKKYNEIIESWAQ